MSRSVWKIPFISNILFSNSLKKKNFTVWSRCSTIPQIFVNKKLRVYNGTWYLSLNVKPSMVGKKFGEFSFTKRTGSSIHTGSKKKKKK